VREFAAYTSDLHALADWLAEHKIQTVAMEATGVYWVALFEVLRDRGFEVCLVDARATKQVAGRKSDISDCQWIQELHSYGLLKQAFIPEAQIATLRSYVRQRDRWVADAGRAIQHMQQALELMNIKLTEVVNDITGTTGMAIIDSILAGERDAGRLSELRNPRCSRSQEEIARALLGSWREEHLFALSQARDYYRYLVNGLRPVTRGSPLRWLPVRAQTDLIRSCPRSANATPAPILLASMPTVIASVWPVSISPPLTGWEPIRF
jgi:hypothetical protein